MKLSKIIFIFEMILIIVTSSLLISRDEILQFLGLILGLLLLFSIPIAAKLECYELLGNLNSTQ